MVCGSSVRLFQLNQKYCQMIAIKLPQSKQNRYNSINLIYAISATPYAVALAAFLLYDAKSMSEYGAAFVALLTEIESMLIYFTLLWKLEDTLRYIENCEAFIEKSERGGCSFMKSSISFKYVDMFSFANRTA